MSNEINENELMLFARIASELSESERETFIRLLEPSQRSRVIDLLERSKSSPAEIDLGKTIDHFSETKTIAGGQQPEPALDPSITSDETILCSTIPASEMQERFADANEKNDETVLTQTVQIGETQNLPDLSDDHTNRFADGDKTDDPLATVNSSESETLDTSHPDLEPHSSLRFYARGAVGEIYIAYDHDLARNVALKRIRPKWVKSKSRRDRFFREAVITGQLQHPGIVPVYRLNDADGQPHYTMPLVRGNTLSAEIKEVHAKMGEELIHKTVWMQNIRPLLIRFVTVCNTMDFAHEKGVLHRDLKPSNIMVADKGRTLVLDWGCAKRIGQSDEISADGVETGTLNVGTLNINDTRDGVVLGTPAFMSPEQAAGKIRELSPASDVFSLGACLFRLLTNKVALENTSTSPDELTEVLAGIQAGDFHKVNDIDLRVPKPLAAICHKAMELEPKNRYASAGDLARDLESFLAGETVDAYPEPFADRAKRFIKNHQAAVTTVLGMMIVGLISLMISTFMLGKKRDALADSNRQLQQRESVIVNNLYNTEMLLASEAATAGGLGRIRELTQKWDEPKHADITGWEWRYLNQLGHQEQARLKVDGIADDIQFVRDEPLAKVLFLAQSKVVTVDPVTGKSSASVAIEPGVTAADFGPNHKLLAMGFGDGRIRVIEPGNPGFETIEFDKHDSAITDIRWNIGGDQLAVCDQSGKLRVWSWYERKIVGDGSGVHGQLGKRHLAWSYDGFSIAWTTSTQLFQFDTRSKKTTQILRDDWIANPCWSHEGKLIAYIGPENTIVVHDTTNNRTVKMSGHRLFIESLGWHPNKHFLTSASADGSIRVWNADSFKEVRRFIGHTGPVYAASWSANGKQIVSAGLPEDEMRFWNIADLGEKAIDRELSDRPAISWHPDANQLAVGEGYDILIQDNQGKTRLIPGSDGSQLIFSLQFSPDGKKIACVSNKGRVWVLDAQNQEHNILFDAGGDVDLSPEVSAKAVGWSPDGTQLAAVSSGGKLRVWNVQTKETIYTQEDGSVTTVLAWAPAQPGTPDRIAFAGTNDDIRVIQVDTGTEVCSITQYGWKTALQWSPDGSQIAVGNLRRVSVYDVASQSLVNTADGPNATVKDLSWNASQRRVVGFCEEGKLHLWNTDTWQYCASFASHSRTPYAVAWSPDGKRMVSTSRHGRIIFKGTADSK